MKRFLLVLISIILVISLCACDNSNKVSEEDLVKNATKAILRAKLLYYDTVGAPHITYYLEKQSSTKYYVSGKVTVSDKYGDSYTGKYDAVVEYMPGGEWRATSCNLDTPTKGK